MKNDSQLQQDVHTELTWEPSVNAAHIGVEVRDGIVTLAVHVDSYAEKWGAERAAQRVAGVKGLAIEMSVKLPGPSQRTDADIAHSVENVLAWSTYVPQESVKVMVEKGWVTLTGQLDWEFERRNAVAAASQLMGVTGVSDQITLEPKVSTTVVKADIEAALKRRAHQNSQWISVSVNGSEVTLTDTARSWAERDLATRAAWSAPGVRNVVDSIAISY